MIEQRQNSVEGPPDYEHDPKEDDESPAAGVLGQPASRHLPDRQLFFRRFPGVRWSALLCVW